MRLSILNGYAPTNVTKSDSAKSAFYSALTKAKKDLNEKPRYKLIALGDFKATISTQGKESGSWEPILGHNNSDRVETNDNGERLLAWCLENQMKITNTIFRTKRIHRETWRHAATGRWKRVDYICIFNWIFRFVSSCRVFIAPSALFDTDHRLLVMNIQFPCNKTELRHQLSRPRADKARQRTKIEELVINPKARQGLTELLERELDEIQIDDLDALNEKITNTVIE